jgi:aspartate ammonia-lyase
MPGAETRVEHDLLGERWVPADAYYGIHTLRARENFPITGIAISTYPDLVNALASVKQAAAAAHRDLGLLSAEKAAAIIKACEDVRAGQLHEEFVVDVIQGGAGTSANMNANEVIANRALEHLGHRRGEYEFLHPLDDVNQGQSTNDVHPTAVKVALRWAAGRLLEAMDVLRTAFADSSTKARDLTRMGVGTLASPSRRHLHRHPMTH